MKKFVLLFLLAFAALFFRASGRVLAVDQDQLKKYLTVEAAVLGASDNVSIDFQNLDGSTEVAMSPTRSWIPASTIKAYVLVEVFNQVRQGLISFDDVVTIKAGNVVATALETDEFPRLREGAQATVRQLAEAMIIQSDNTAYNILIDVLDRRKINNTLRSLGMTETVVGEKLNLDDSQYQADSQTPGYQHNTTTVKDYVNLFFLLANDKIPGSVEMLAIFRRQKFNDMIPALIPKSVAVAHKTGFWAPIYHDGGVVYKPDSPFVLGIFSNANDPTVNARLAKVAYYHNSDSVGVSMDPGPDPANNQSYNNTYPVITLAQGPSDKDLKVLAAETNSKFPEVTAADLGITSADLTTGLDDARSIKPAVVFPGSWIYFLKRGLEVAQLAMAGNSSQRTDILLSIAHARLSEMKSLGQSNRPDLVGSLVRDEQSNLSEAANLAKNNTGPERQLSQVKVLSDMSFAVAGDGLTQSKGADKEKLIDSIYTGFVKNQREVAPIVQKSLPTSPFNEPLIGTVQEVKDSKVTVAFADGSTRTVLINPNTPSRAFGQKTLEQGALTASVGARIAVVGEMTKTGEIVPNFILRSIPKEIPERKEGIVIKIDPPNHSLEIKQSDGKNATVVVEPTTNIKGRDTDVSLSGIKAGSTVTIFGSGLPSTQAASASQSGVVTPPSTPSAKTSGSSGNASGNTSTTKTSLKQTAPVSTPTQTETVIKATTITVTKNSSGKNEVIETPKKAEPKPPVKKETTKALPSPSPAVLPQDKKR